MRPNCPETEKPTQGQCIRKWWKQSRTSVVSIAMENSFNNLAPDSEFAFKPSGKANSIRQKSFRRQQSHTAGLAHKKRANVFQRGDCRRQHTAGPHISHKGAIQLFIPLEHRVIVELRQRGSLDFFKVPPHSLVFLLQIPSAC